MSNTITAEPLAHGRRQTPFWRRLADRLVEARLRQAERAVARILAGLADADLQSAGLTREEIAALRATGRLVRRVGTA